jgi:5-methylcytosine-specific restriction endonuclease McrA
MRVSLLLLTSHGKECPYCGEVMYVPPKGMRKRHGHPRFPTRDHVIPKSVVPGQQILIVCRQCNLDKGNRTLNQWLAELKRKNDPRAAVVSAKYHKIKDRLADLEGLNGILASNVAGLATVRHEGEDSQDGETTRL